MEIVYKKIIYHANIVVTIR